MKSKLWLILVLMFALNMPIAYTPVKHVPTSISHYGFLLADDVSADTARYDVTSDVAVTWQIIPTGSGTHCSQVDDATTNPATPTTDGVYWMNTGTGLETFGLTGSLPDGAAISNVTINSYGNLNVVAGDFGLGNIKYSDGTWSDTTSFAFPASAAWRTISINTNKVPAWVRLVGVTHTGAPPGSYLGVTAVYVVVTYTTGGGGGAATTGKVVFIRE